ncbi:MAG: S41 family peptidase [Chitinophagales bacterium]
MKYSVCFFLAFLLFNYSLLAQEKGYYRNPAIYQNTVFFTAEGDLWKYDMTSGVTSRLTTNPGIERNPVVSPDGKQIVFVGAYEGVSDLYLMSINGGVPKRLTYDFDGRIKTAGWTNDGKVMYTSNRYNSLPDEQMIKLDPNTLSYKVVPLAQVSDGCYDENGILFFSRLPKQGSNNKRYVGGTIQQLWKYDGKEEAKCLTCDFDGTSYNPMIYKNNIYFASDRDGSMNIWSMNKDGKSLKQLTFSKEWDIKSPAMYGSKIVYQRGADLWVYDVETNQAKMLDITLSSDFDQRKPRWIKNPVESITFTNLSPKGNYTAIISRGRLFVAPIKGDRWVEINRKSGIRFKEVHFLDERTLIYMSDESGEFEIWKTAADGTGTPQQLTKNSKILIRAISVSPDGKFIAYIDKDETLRVIDATAGSVRFQYTDTDFGIGDISWSSNSQYFTFSHGLVNQTSQISSVEIASGKMTALTSDRLDSYTSSWSSNDHWLYFLSDRKFMTKVRAPWGSRQPEPYYTGTTAIYALQADTSEKFPFTPKDAWRQEDTSTKQAKDDTKSSKTKPVVTASSKAIDWNLTKRMLYTIPVKAGNLGSLSMGDGVLYWLDYGESTDGTAKLFALKTEYNKEAQPTEVASGINQFQISADRKKILIIKGRTMAAGNANGEKIDIDKNKIELANWNFQIDPVEDWKEIFMDAWRMMRDYFYDRDLHKVDWVAVRKQHEILLDRISDRYELDDLIAQMVSELSTLHTFVFGGDKRVSPDQIPTGFLGARFQTNPKGIKIDHIYKSDPDYPESSSPLDKPDLSIKDGDIITSIDDVPLKTVQDISVLLANKVDVTVKLSLLNSQMQSYSQEVKPISAFAETMLRYNEWELTCRTKVDSSSDDQIGYIHLKTMGSGDMDDFVRQFYPIYNRQGLIIDVRHNGGGNIDSWILEKLMRKAWMYWKGRTGKPYWNMQYAFRGHMVVLCDQFTGSDGEAFTEGFRRLGLGKVIGMRTWGGEIWLSADNVLVDNGIATAAEYGVYGPEGKWLIEGHGVDPDVVVDNLPNETFKGKDAQLEYAINYLKEQIKKEPVVVPPVPAYPDKSFKYKAY